MFLQKKILLFSFYLLSTTYLWAQRSAEAKLASPKDTINLNFLSPNQVSLTDSVVNYGKLFLNTPYRYGSTGTDTFDCSGFTSYIYRNFGYSLQRNSEEQAQQFDTINRTQLKTGDLVFFSGRRRSSKVGHVGIVVSAKENGEFDFIHSAVHTGVTISNSTEPYYSKRFIKANRVVGFNPMLAVKQPIENTPETVKETPIFTPFSGVSQKTKKIIPAEYHRVKSGETLSSIALKYGMSIAELKEKNDLKSNKINRKQSLLVKDEETIMVLEAPKSIANNTTKIGSSSVAQDETSSKTSHIVQKGETLTSIAKQENVSIEDLKSINKLASGNVNIGQELKLKTVVESTKEVANPIAKNDSKLKIHKVLKGESLYSIAKANNISIDELQKINNLKSGSVNAGQELKLNIPVSTEIEASSSLAKNNAKPATHKVLKGESLYTIAKNYNTSIDELKKINNLKSDNVNAGQELMLNTHTSAEIEVSSSSFAKNSTKSVTHKVQKGESLYTIAKTYDTTIEELKRINNIDGKNLQAGQELKITDKKEIAIVETKIDAKNASKSSEYRVKKGESLFTISKNTNISIDELKRINNLETSNIQSGQMLKISDNQENNTGSTSKKKSEPKSITHRVNPGESFYSIAKAYNCTIENIKEWNNLTSNKINAGDKLIIFSEKI